MAVSSRDPEKEQDGRPPKYETPQQMQDAVNEYFAVCEQGREVKWINKKSELQTAILTATPDWTGLALHLGFATRHSLNDYIGRKKIGNEHSSEDLPDKTQLSFAYILLRAKSKIEVYKKSAAEYGILNDRMIKLDLSCNHGYIEKHQHELGNIDDNELKVSFVDSQVTDKVKD